MCGNSQFKYSFCKSSFVCLDYCLEFPIRSLQSEDDMNKFKCICILFVMLRPTRLDYQPLFGKGAHAQESGGNRAYPLVRIFNKFLFTMNICFLSSMSPIRTAAYLFRGFIYFISIFVSIYFIIFLFYFILYCLQSHQPILPGSFFRHFFGCFSAVARHQAKIIDPEKERRTNCTEG